MNELVLVMKGERMPIKDLAKRREYKRLWIANKRKQNVEPIVEPSQNVEPSLIVEPGLKVEPGNNFVEPWHVEPVEPKAGVEPAPTVEPRRVEPEKNVEPCPRNHYSLTELFQQATIKIKQDYQTIYKDSETSRKCFDCHNRERNYQILLNLLERY